jgi:hypothetical protein
MAAQAPPAKPQYWVAVLSVGMSQADKDSFHKYLKGFCDAIGSGFGPSASPRCYYSQMKTRPDEACIKGGKPVPNCEALEVYWDRESQTDAKAGWYLKIVMQEAGNNGLDGPSGEIFSHRCPLDNTFEDCFENQQERMLEMVRKHDANCHEGCKCIVTKDKRLACPGQ